MVKFIDEFRSKDLVKQLLKQINEISKKEVAFMEVCGGHTMSIHKFGIPSLLPSNIKLLSGPGCPVCVSDKKFIDQSIAYARLDDVIITTFGDLIRVPGSTSSLEKEKAAGKNVKIVYSILDAIKIAKENPSKKIIFLGIGFETTAPTTAAGIQKAASEKLHNFFVFSSHKIMPPAMAALIDEGVKLSGYIAPGHVSTITGSKIYTDVAEKYKLACVIAGFEPVDILKSIYMLVKQVETNSPKVEIEYSRAVLPEGNIKAQEIMADVFEFRDDWWRGLGILANSGLKISKKYKAFDAEENFVVEVEKTIEEKGCICGEILKGLKSPKDCKLFAKACSPLNPVGACMVSSEGSCHAHYKYSR
ncbi:MAG TPA: hydrogenase formation protein HypD [Bacteroidales bacterium]|nr:MAG: hydrogenase formation protein HypD [Bacteroidetes bacterium GWF2_33_38]OFY74956.1 MAG: hydrogenase formation protein HypD [Bacteroidetes bacterium RIFOXYA12_FULL_33_9]OFY88730.1 MAG: hydrogenase formation protein HypD [Bacteroidetes bacterium RIFOXYA2_FULL_33_7]HBF88778.1 hydrogenase formation protein HypD [Bacteroidales bacterium]